MSEPTPMVLSWYTVTDDYRFPPSAHVSVARDSLWNFLVTDAADAILPLAAVKDENPDEIRHLQGMLKYHLFAYWYVEDELFGIGHGVVMRYVASANNRLWLNIKAAKLKEKKLPFTATGSEMRKRI